MRHHLYARIKMLWKYSQAEHRDAIDLSIKTRPENDSMNLRMKYAQDNVNDT